MNKRIPSTDQRCLRPIDDDQKTTATIAQERTYVFDKDYRCDPWDRPNLYNQSSFTFKEHTTAPSVNQNTNAHDGQPSSRIPKEDTDGSNRKPIFSDDFPVSLNSIK